VLDFCCINAPNCIAQQRWGNVAVGGSQRSKRDQVTDEAGLSEAGGEARASRSARPRAGAGNGKGRERRHDAPRWRQIEIMRERKALQEMLDDFGDHDISIDEEIFGFGVNQDVYFRSVAEDDEVVEDVLDDDDFPEDDFEED
jgi:hypothetical protein